MFITKHLKRIFPIIGCFWALKTKHYCWMDRWTNRQIDWFMNGQIEWDYWTDNKLMDINGLTIDGWINPKDFLIYYNIVLYFVSII